MPLDAKFLEILCCPATQQPVKMLTSQRLDKLNAAIRQGKVLYSDGQPVESPLEEALLTADNQTIYKIVSGIPVMLTSNAIPTRQLVDFGQE